MLRVACTSTFVDLQHIKELKKAISKRTKLIWIETPTNPMLTIVDIAKVCDYARKKGILTCVDNTFASPYLQNPLDLGADMVIHSATKYLGGHSDVVHGAVVTNHEPTAERLHYLQNAVGAVPGPQDCFLVLRGIKTLHLRVQRACDNARKIAEFLRNHSKIKQAFYPGFKDHPNHKVAKKQMRDFGGMVSFDLVKNDFENKSWRFVDKDFEFADYLVPTYYVLTTAEASTNLSRYDGVRYGHRSQSSETLEEMYVNSRTEGFGKEVKRRIMLGTYVLSEGYFDAYFTKAQQVRKLITEEMDKVLEDCDFLILPASTTLPWKIGEMGEDPVAVYLSDMYTVLANLTGLPAISVPSGNNSKGLPFGIQLMSKKYSEYELLSISKSIKFTTTK